jgi:uncharacterized protein (DUF2141 family)
MKINSIIPYLVISVIVLYASCAKQTAPTGGPRDTIPPELLSANPKNNQINYKGDKLELTFNEFIVLENAKEQILITPDINKNYEAVAKKKKLEITFKEKLKDSTTYLINFQSAVKDITEKNPPENLKIAFSTGTYIDSLTIKGKVIDPLLNKPIKNLTVALYESDTFSVFSHKPSYISRTNDKGLFSIENLKHGRYYIYAFNDANRNLLIDSRTEAYAFNPQPFELSKNISDTQLNLIKLDSRPIKLASARPYNTYFNIKLSKPIDRFVVKTANNDSIFAITGEDNASLKIYNTITADSLPVNVTVWDSLEQSIDTLVYAKFLEKKSTPEPFEVITSKWKLLKEKGKIEGTITYNKPIREINFDSIFFQVDSLTIIPFTARDLSINADDNTITVSKAFDKSLLKEKQKTEAAPIQRPKPDTTTTRQNRPVTDKNTDRPEQPSPIIMNELHFGKAAFISIESDSSSEVMEVLRPLTVEETGIIRLNIQTIQPYIIVQLLDKTNTIVQAVRNKSAISFEDLPPGDYQIRLIIDSNNDGRWSPGNIYRRQETEPVQFYKNEKDNTTINLKANWEVGPLLISH